VNGVDATVQPGIGLSDQLPVQVKVLNSTYSVANLKQTKLVRGEFEIQINQNQQ
jgi:hypothetical protein